MKSLKTRLALPAAALAVMATAPGATMAADEVIPPGNSAATQYTEAFPTPGGDKKTDEAAHHRSPVKVLGDGNTRKLKQQGPDGQAAAETAAATAPAPVAAETPAEPTDEAPDEDSVGSGSGKGAGGNGSAPQNRQPSSGGTGTQAASTDLPEGSSGISSAIEQATGLSTSGQSGLLLPLVILATIALSIAYLWRQRRQVD